MEIPEHKLNAVWLFADNVTPNVYKFLSYIPDYKTSTGKKIPAFLFYGATVQKNGIVQSECVTSIWSIENLNEIRQKLGADDKNWLNAFFYIRSANGKTDKGTKLKLELVV